LFRFYNKEVLGYEQPKGVIGAKDFYVNYDTDPILKKNFKKIANTPTAVPQKGDVMIWDKWTGNPYGHVSIYLDGDVNKFNSLDQNWNNLQRVEKVLHNYTAPKVLGWLRPNNIMALKDTVIDFDDGEKNRHTVGWYVAEWYGEKQRAEKLVKENAELVKEMDKLRSENKSLRETNAKLSTEVTEVTGKNIAYMNEITALNKQLEGLKGDIETLSEANKLLIDELERVKLSLDVCKKGSLETLTLGDFFSWVGLKMGVKK
jgi:SMC interacting uncharacterized protein involved in chromosome segregation